MTDHIGHPHLPMPFDDRVGLSAAAMAALAPCRYFQGLNDAINWGIALSPQAIFLDAVIQDEYTHDIIFSYKDGMYLVWDTT